MPIKYKTMSAWLSVLLLTACASVPNGPSAMALPGSGKDFDHFRVDDAGCRQYAQEQIGGTTANQASNDSFARSAAVGTVIGAAIGAAAGGGHGAGVGAATGLAAGSMIGVNEANMSSATVQQRYDNAYTQCMYAKGNQVPVSTRGVAPRRLRAAPPTVAYPPPPPPGYAPVPPGAYVPPSAYPPPPGNPPPPPADAPK